MFRRSSALILAAFLGVAPAARAQAPSTLSYQGVLTDGAGNLVADGDYAITFRIYDVAAGGVALFTQALPAVPVERGGFSVVLTGVSLPFDQPYHLGIQVGADPELSPRVALTASPYAMSLRLPFSQVVAHANPLLELRNSGTGLDARFLKRVDLGSPTSTAELDLFRSSVTAPVARLYSTASGGNLDLFDESGAIVAALESDGSGSGGYLSVRRSATQAGFTVDGNWSGSNEPLVTIVGGARSVTFNVSAGGNASVALPADAISAAETLDEAGIANANNSIQTPMIGGPEVILTRTVTCPTDGYCLVIGSVEVTVIHTNGAASGGIFGITTTTNSLPSSQGFELDLPAEAATGSYKFPVTAQGVFAVTAGANTFNFLGSEEIGSLRYDDCSLSVLFVPTAYGIADPPAPAASLPPGGEGSGVARATAAGLLAERAEADRLHRARVDGELAAMRAQLSDLQRKLEEAAREQSGSRAEGR